MIKNNLQARYIFFGSSRFSVISLEELKKLHCLPTLIVTTPEKPRGRYLKTSPSVVWVWAEQNKIECITPSSLKEKSVAQELDSRGPWDVFVVASYGKIIPNEILNLPRHKILNIHPSLLPKLRGPTPIQTAILNDEKTGVTIMLMDEKIDHGPILAQKKINVKNWPMDYMTLEEIMAKEGANLLTESIPKWLKGEIKTTEQNDAEATFTKKISKEDSLIDLSSDPNLNLRKIKALSPEPGVYFLAKHAGKDVRVTITDASVKNNILTIEKVKPEGKKEMSYSDFVRGLRR